MCRVGRNQNYFKGGTQVKLIGAIGLFFITFITFAGDADIMSYDVSVAVKQGDPIVGTYWRKSPTTKTNYSVTFTATDETEGENPPVSVTYNAISGKFTIPTTTLEAGVVKITALDSEGHTQSREKSVDVLKVTLQAGGKAVAVVAKAIILPGPPPPVSYDRVAFTVFAFARPEGGESSHDAIFNSGAGEVGNSKKKVNKRLYSQKTVVQLNAALPAAIKGTAVSQSVTYSKSGATTDPASEALAVELP
jgi:hypothetical protein